MRIAILALAALFLVKQFTAVYASDDSGAPELCADVFGVPNDIRVKLVSIALNEAQHKDVSLNGYNSIFIIRFGRVTTFRIEIDKATGKQTHKEKPYTPSPASQPQRPSDFGVRFSPFHCGQL